MSPPLQFADIPNDNNLRRFGVLPATLGETLEAVIGDPTLRPTQLLARQKEIEDAPRRGGFLGVDVGRDAMEAAGSVEPRPEPELASPDSLNEEYGHLGLSFDRPTSRRTAEIMARNKREEIIRKDIVARGPTGFLPTVAKFGAALAGAVIDPLNVAIGFVPVVGEARFAGMAARMGTTGARFSRGAIEGVVGNALIEPVVYGLSQQQQLDYKMSDALLNVTLGGFIGGGFHVGAGKVGDLLTKAGPEVRETALRAAVAQAVDGRSVEVEGILRTDSAAASGSTPRARSVNVEQISPQSVEVVRTFEPLLDDSRLLEERIREAFDAQPVRVERLVSFLKKIGGLREESEELVTMGITSRTQPGLIRRQGKDFDEAGEAAFEAGFFPQRPTVAEFLDAVRDDFEGREVVREADIGEIEARGEMDTLRSGLEEIGITRDMPIEESAARLDLAARRLRSQQQETDEIPFEAVAQREALPQRDASADFEASASVAKAVSERQGLIDPNAESAKAEADFAAEQLAEMRERGLLDDATMASLDAANDTLDHAQALGRAAKAGARCLARVG